jgi:hypothetical protein
MWFLAPLENDLEIELGLKKSSSSSRWLIGALFLHITLLMLSLALSSVHSLQRKNLKKAQSLVVRTVAAPISLEAIIAEKIPSPSMTPIPQVLKEPTRDVHLESQERVKAMEESQKRIKEEAPQIPKQDLSDTQPKRTKEKAPEATPQKVSKKAAKQKIETPINKKSAKENLKEKKKEQKVKEKTSSKPKPQETKAKIEKAQNKNTHEKKKVEQGDLAQKAAELQRQKNLEQALASLNNVATGSSAIVAVAAEVVHTPQKIAKLQSDSLPFVDCQGSAAFSVGESCYVDDLVRRIKMQLKLPEVGQVQIELTITRGGEVEVVRVKRSSSKKNEQSLLSKIHRLKFAPFKENFKGELRHTFSIILSNEVE